jgi:hypothetical protein
MQSKKMVCQKWMRSNSASPRLPNLRVKRWTPTEHVGWRSTETVLNCSANGGEKGGLVRIEIEGADNLVQYNGKPLPYMKALEPSETISFKNTYRAVKESKAANDIKVTATFVERETEWSQETTDEATAVKVEIEPRVMRDGCPNRHLLGVRESVYVRTHPDVERRIALEEDWQLLGTDYYLCPSQTFDNGLALTIGGVDYEPHLSVCEPTGIICKRGWTLPLGSHPGEAGWTGMKLDLTVLPETVSFSGLAFVEVANDEGTREGYFASEEFAASQSHDESQGAGVWHDISDDNFFFYDCPRLVGQCQSPWREGVIAWPIPIAWGERGTTSMVGKMYELPVVYRQTFTIDAQGRLRIDKYGQWVLRWPTGTYEHSEDLIEVSE